jgi:hypothetical protein
MRYRRIALMIAFYVTVDLTNPFIGCAFNFNAEESIDGVSRPHERLLPQTIPGALPTPSGGDRAGIEHPAPARPFTARLLGEWLVQMRQAHEPHSDPQSPTEDH